MLLQSIFSLSSFTKTNCKKPKTVTILRHRKCNRKTVPIVSNVKTSSLSGIITSGVTTHNKKHPSNDTKFFFKYCLIFWFFISSLKKQCSINRNNLKQIVIANEQSERGNPLKTTVIAKFDNVKLWQSPDLMCCFP